MSISNKKLSHYTVFTDEISENNKSRVVLATRSARASIISNEIYAALQNNTLETLPKEIFNKLCEEKILIDRSENELEAIIKENKEYTENDTVLYHVIQPSAMCQLGCDYCGQDHKKKNISYLHMEKLIERLEFKLKSSPGSFQTLFIGWFGGEPLLALNEIRMMTKELKKLAKKYNVAYGSKIVTNGLSLKSGVYRELVEECAVRSIEVTLDGPAEYHDKRRNTKEGYSTYDIITKNLKEIFNLEDYFDLRCPISIRCNVDKRNYLGVSTLMEQMAKNNFQKYISYFYVASVYSWGNDAHLKSFSKEEFANMEIDWLIEQYSYGFNPNLLPGRVRSVCLAVNPNSEMTDAYGNLFNCTEVSYVEAYENTEYVLGNLSIDQTEKQYNRPLSEWNNEILENKLPCHTCKMLPVCGGGCPKSWHEDMSACPTNKFNIKEKLLLSYIQSKTDIKELIN